MCNILTKEDVEMTVELDVRVEDETVWLTQAQMSQLFSVKEHTITYHIKEIYKSEELEEKGTARKIRVVRKEGNRLVNRELDFRHTISGVVCAESCALDLIVF